MFSIRVEQGHFWYSLIVQKSGPDHHLLVNRDPYTVIEKYMEQSLDIGLYWPFSNLPIGICAIYFDLKVMVYYHPYKTGLDFIPYIIYSPTNRVFYVGHMKPSEHEIFSTSNAGYLQWRVVSLV